MEEWMGALVILAAYVLGSIPSAYIVLRLLSGTDIRAVGTGNVGALNAYQQRGPLIGAPILIADIGKAVIAVLLPSWLGIGDWASYCAAFAVVAGHNWPVFLKFRGGRGAATTVGVGLALAPILTLIALIPLVLAVALTKNVVVGALTAILLFNLLTIATGQPWSLIGVCGALTLAVIVNYAIRSMTQIVGAVRRRRWRSLVYPE